MDRIELGKKGEEIALEYLLQRGYKLVVKNFKNKIGEVDLVMRKDGVIVGVEVKAKMEGGIEPSVMLTPKKIKKVKEVLMSFPWECQGRRVECVTVLMASDYSSFRVEHFDEAI